MKPSIRLAGIVALAAAAPAAAQTQYWIHQFGTLGYDALGVLAPDGAGGVLVAGGISNAACEPSHPWIARYSAAGTQLWTREFDSGAWDVTRAIASDGAGGAFVAGETTGSLAGPNAGSFDAWVARYDGAGTRLWMIQFGDAYWDMASALAPDGAGGTFVAGNKASMGAWGLTQWDCWLARHAADGSRLWWVRFGSRGDDEACALAPDGAGGAFVGGTGRYGTGSPSGLSDAWLARFDGAGRVLWVHSHGLNGTEGVSALASDGRGGVFAAGDTSGGLAGAYAGVRDAWIAHYDGDGARTWFHQFGVDKNDHITVAADGTGGAFFAGTTRGSMNGPPAGSHDGWLARHDGRGNRLWIRQFGTNMSDSAFGLLSAGAGQVWVAGSTGGSLGGPHAGDFDGWIGRFGPCSIDCNEDIHVTVADFGCFQTRFVAGDPYADCNKDGTLTIADFGCFQSAFVAGCP